MRAIAWFGLIFLSACLWLNPYPSTAEAVTLKFRKAILKGDFKQARQYCDEGSAGFLSLVEGIYDMSPIESKAQNRDLAHSLYIISCRLNANKTRARCTVCCNENNDIFPDPTILTLVDNRWLVWVSKLGEDDFEEEDFE